MARTAEQQAAWDRVMGDSTTVAAQQAAHPIRLLIHTTQDMDRYVAITTILARATTLYQKNFDLVVGEPNMVDHIGYHDGTLSSVVWVREDGTQYMRLTVRPGRHAIFDELLQAAIA